MDSHFASTFASTDSQPWTELGAGIRRKVVGHTPALMAVLVEFDKGAIGTPHTHEAHDQICFVLAGSFEAEVAGVKRLMKKGDAYIVPPNTLHGVVALEDKSVLLDHFTPRREDYLGP
jgi:quercetin dioxygenase-like cupin family protein